MNEVRKIDLHLPCGWNDCTTRELEQICAAMLLRQQQATRLRPFDWAQVKVDVVLAVNGLKVLKALEVPAPTHVLTPCDRGQDPVTTQTDENAGDRNLSPVTLAVRLRRDRYLSPVTFEITPGQMLDLCSRLDWIDAPTDRQQPLYRFPYPKLRLQLLHRYKGPGIMLDGYTWTEYRLLQDWMQSYMTWQNRLLQLRHDRHVTAERYYDAAQAVDDARSHFLSVLFRAKHALTNPDRAARPFREFDPVRWQVILLWWSSLMQQLMKKFPRVFKPQDVGNGRRKQQKHQSPWDFYNHVTATLADEFKTSESEQAAETYSVTLQKLENMAEKSAEMERISKKK